MTETMITVAEAADRLGIRLRTLQTRIERGRIRQAVKLPKGTRLVWMLPTEHPEDIVHPVRPSRQRAKGPMPEDDGRCDKCDILLERSGDALHANDARDAGRCWACREMYGEGAQA